MKTVLIIPEGAEAEAIRIFLVTQVGIPVQCAVAYGAVSILVDPKDHKRAAAACQGWCAAEKYFSKPPPSVAKAIKTL